MNVELNNKLQLTESDMAQIEILCEERYNFAIFQDRILTYLSFDSSTIASGMSIEYNTFYAIDVTHFIKLNKAAHGQAALKNEFRRYVEKRVYLYWRLNKTIDFITITNSI